MHGHNGFVLGWLGVGVGVGVWEEENGKMWSEVHITDKMIAENCKLPILSLPPFICSFHYIFIISLGITFVFKGKRFIKQKKNKASREIDPKKESMNEEKQKGIRQAKSYTKKQRKQRLACLMVSYIWWDIRRQIN